MTYYFPRLDRISYIEVTSPPFFGDFFTNPHSVLPILGFISQTHSNGFWKNNNELRNMHNFTMRLSGFCFALYANLEASKMGMRIWKFQRWNWSRVPLSAAMSNGFDFAHRYFKTRKGREIVTRARSLIEFNRNRNTIIEGREKMCNQWFSFLIVFLCMAIAKTIFQIPRHQITITWCVGFWAHNRMRI